jgi:hypothetical protein
LIARCNFVSTIERSTMKRVYGDDSEAYADAIADASAERAEAQREAAPDPIQCESCAHFYGGEAQSPDSPGYPPWCDYVGEPTYAGGNTGLMMLWKEDEFEAVLHGFAICPHYHGRTVR